MKKLLTICLTLVPCVLMAAANKIKMVTYFPVPYVAYSRVSADQMDIGLTQACSMKLGCSESGSPLETPAVNVQSGKLELNGGLGILGNTIGLGAGNSTTGHLEFSKVRINEGTMASINNAETMTVTELNLFNRAFPSCNEANSESNGQVSWQMLELNGASNQELYLVCGTPSKTGSCEPTHNGDLEYTEDCPEGYTGTIDYTWVPALCVYLRDYNCEKEETCFRSSTWKTVKQSSSLASGSWVQSAGGVNAESVCGEGAQSINSLKDECIAGQIYLYDPYKCNTRDGDTLQWGGYCLKCSKKSSTSICTSKVENKSGQTCGTEFKPIDNGNGSLTGPGYDDIIANPGETVIDGNSI